MSSVELRQITKRFPSVLALDQVSFHLRDREFFVLLGPTGAGKTTTLRIIAALEKQDAGNVLFDDEVVDALTPSDRDVAFVFQQYSLYPTMTVFDNLAFPLRSPLRRLPAAEIKQRVNATAEILRISHLLDRKTARLSGGEMQRVAIGRAIVREPRLFLMDEPLSNLDAKLRETLRVELQHMQKTQGYTTLFVTHDQIEALTLADRIGVLNEGRIIQVGTPEAIYDQPATTFVAQLVGSPRINLLPATRTDGRILIDDSDLKLEAPVGVKLPAQLQVGIRPEDIKIGPEGRFAASCVLIEPLGVESILHLECGKRPLLSLQPGMTALRLHDNVRFDIIEDRLHFFDQAGRRISNQ